MPFMLGKKAWSKKIVMIDINGNVFDFGLGTMFVTIIV